MNNKLKPKLKEIEKSLKENMRELYFLHHGKNPSDDKLDRIYDHYLQIQLDFDRLERTILEHTSEQMMDIIKKNPKLTKIFDDLDLEYDDDVMDKFYSLYKRD